ncbi:hypothetical protein KJ853_01780 [Patescibacteria group bacterium]|nr:hypothetical protein [Patescibacteria group bacterium]
MEPAVLETKLDILKRVIKQWRPSLDEESMDTFRFIAAVVRPANEGSGCVYDQKARDKRKYIHPTEGKEILAIIREHTNEKWDDDSLSRWIVEPMPSELRRILLIAKGRSISSQRAWLEIEGYNLLLHVGQYKKWDSEAKFF